MPSRDRAARPPPPGRPIASHARFDADRLRARLRANGERVSVVLPARNEAATVGEVVDTIRRTLVDRVGLVDELLVVDAGSLAESRQPTPMEPYRVRLLFGLPPHGQPRIFDVVVQGKTVRKNLTLDRDSSGTSHASATIPSVMIGDELEIQLVPKSGQPLLSGLELVRQGAGTGR